MGTPDAQAEPRYEELAPRVRHRLTVLSLLRAVVAASVLVALYFLLPLDGRSNGALVVDLVVGLVVFAAVVAARSPAPTRSTTPSPSSAPWASAISPRPPSRPGS